VVSGKCDKYVDRTVQLCDVVWLGESVVNMGFGLYMLCVGVWLGECVVNMGIGLHCCVLECG
jgi:hypothetical protein